MKTKSAFISIVGKANAGKSTLLNAFMGSKISIVSPKPQTTRTKITGILTKDDTQLVFFDTPGIFSPKNPLGDAMVKTATDTVNDVDIVLYVVSCGDELSPTDKKIIKSIKDANCKAILVINKIDIRPKEMILKTIKTFCDEYDFYDVYPISALKKDGTDAILKELFSLSSESVFFYDANEKTDMSNATLISEIVREKMLLFLGNEVPHGVFVSCDSFYEENKIIKISCMIYCEKESHKPIIIGKSGKMIKQIGQASRISLEKHFDKKVFLELFVKVKKDWRLKEDVILSLGFSQ